MKAFKAYDIRGIFNKDFNLEDAYRIGFYLPRLLETRSVLVGRDVRNSSEDIFESLAKGITDNGAYVYDTGLATTPMIYFLTAEEGFSASVMITASHNSKEHNGFKISGENATPIGYTNGLSRLENMIKDQPEPQTKPGKIIPFNRKGHYENFLEKYKKPFFNLSLAIDCSNGMADLFAEKLFGPEPDYINLGMDGDFPGHNPNPLEEENLRTLKKEITENQYDLGIIFDGDADRVMFVDENGNFIQPDMIITLLGEHLLPKEKENKKVLHDIRTSRVVTQKLKELGGEVHMWKVGRTFAAQKLKEIDGLFGGELAGHYYFKDFYYSDSGYLAALIVLDIMSALKQKGITPSAYFKQVNNLYNSGEINFKIENKASMMKNIKSYFTHQQQATAIYDFDGYRVEFPDWWFNIRKSNTEPYLRFIAEAESREKLDKVLQQVKELTQETDL